ncbi:MAG: hypothetical protein H6868_01800 [Rhodospirillales bacterium]|nr:hypothetical protein [Rhodospirillales bacterium]
MYSHLDPIFKTHIRQTETTDTGLHIRRDDPRQQGRKNDRDRKDETDNSLWEDSAEVSVSALRTFLEDLIAPRQKPETSPESSENRETEPLPTQKPVSPQAATAAKAYQHSAETKGEPPVLPSHHSARSSDETANKLTQEDIDMIRRLISELYDLPGHTNLQLSLKPGNSFIQSLIDAVTLAKQAV